MLKKELWLVVSLVAAVSLAVGMASILSNIPGMTGCHRTKFVATFPSVMPSPFHSFLFTDPPLHCRYSFYSN